MSASFFKALADAVAVLHVAIIVFLLSAAFGYKTWIFSKYTIVRRLHIGTVAVTMLSQLIFLGCPLTTLEQSLRHQYDPTTYYYGSFVAHLLLKYANVQVSSILVTTGIWLLVLVSFVGWFTFSTKPTTS